MIWFLLGASLGLSLLDWSGGGGSRRYWSAALGALAAFGLALTLQFPAGTAGCAPRAGIACRGGFLILTGLFLAATTLLGLGSLYRRVSPRSFFALALSDLFLGMAVWVFHDESGLWALPARGGWGAASSWGAAAALLRLGAPIFAVDRAERKGSPPGPGPLGRLPLPPPHLFGPENLKEAGLPSLSWWQGAFLAWWVARPAGLVLAIGGLALWAAAAAVSRSASGALAAAGGLVSVGAALSFDPAGLMGTGLAAFALALGEPLIGLWALAALPLSLPTVAGLPSPVSASGAFGPEWSTWISLLASSVLLPPAWAIVVSKLQPSLMGTGHRGRFVLSRPAGLLASVTAAGAFLTGSPGIEWLLWVAVGAGVSATATLVLLRQPPFGGARAGSPADESLSVQPAQGGGASTPSASQSVEQAPGEGTPAPAKTAFFRPPAGGFARALARGAPAWMLLFLAFVLFGWLFSTGLQTQFL